MREGICGLAQRWALVPGCDRCWACRPDPRYQRIIGDGLLLRPRECMNDNRPHPHDLHEWPCPLCGMHIASGIEVEETRYARCRECDLISLDPSRRPLPLDEVVRYTRHRNRADDDGYRRFLSRLSDHVVARLGAGAQGLDFGCGPSAVLADMLTEAGYPTVGYDPVFEPHGELLSRLYDFAVCSEVVEHFHHPASAFTLLGELVASGGLLGVMTRFHRPDIPFETWWYRRDPTHVCFYSEMTMQWVAAHHDWTLEIPEADIALFRVPRRDH